MRGSSPYCTSAHVSSSVSTPSVAISRVIGGAWRSGRITQMCIAAPKAAPTPSAAAHATQVEAPPSRTS